MNKVVLLIDGSSLAFLHGGKATYKEDLVKHIKALLKRFNTDLFLIVLENSKSNFRNDIAISKEYKGQRRTQKVKDNIDKYLPYLNQVFIEIKANYNPVTCFNVENDDVLAILAKTLPNVVIAGNDIDLLAIEGTHLNLKTNKMTVVQLPGTIDLIDGKLKATGYYQTYAQIIKGSQKENYGGLAGYGDKKTYDLLKTCKTELEMQELCTKLFKQELGDNWESKLKEGFRLCWVIQKNDSLVMPRIMSCNELTVFTQ